METASNFCLSLSCLCRPLKVGLAKICWACVRYSVLVRDVAEAWSASWSASNVKDKIAAPNILVIWTAFDLEGLGPSTA